MSTLSLALAVDPYLRDWLDLLLRLLHVVAAMAWIGTSFYFVLLDQTLRPTRDPADAEAGVRGELWEMHGGGFYRVQKYLVAPRALPDHVAWFKWEAYTTWLSGFGLLVLLFYLDGAGRLVDPSVADLEGWQAVALSLGLLAAAWLAYDGLCRLLESRPLVLGAAIAALTALAAWGSAELFAPRAAWLQVGAMLGTVMAANVFFVIIPSQWQLVRAQQAGREPDPAPGVRGKQRSVHNNFLTLPVLIAMLAGHSTFLVARERAWLILLALMALGASARLFYNLRHTGRTLWAIPAAAGVALVVLALVLRPSDEEAQATPAQLAQGQALFAELGCSDCHTLADAGANGNVGPSLDVARPSRAMVAETVAQGRGGMPAFGSRLDEAELESLAAYVAAAAGAAG